jgi:hypothetical protein
MDAPFWEIIIRAITATVAFFAFASVFTLWRVQTEERHPARYLTAFMSAVTFSLLINRLYITWVGTQTDTDGSYSRDIEPVLRAVGASLLALILLGAGLVAVFGIKHRDVRWK